MITYTVMTAHSPSSLDDSQPCKRDLQRAARGLEQADSHSHMIRHSVQYMHALQVLRKPCTRRRSSTLCWRLPYWAEGQVSWAVCCWVRPSKTGMAGAGVDTGVDGEALM